MSAGMQKPPVAPKPKNAQPQRPGPSPSSTPKRDGLFQASLCTPKTVKPALAPKPPCLPKPFLTTSVESKPPCLPKPCLNAAMEYKPLSSKTVHHHQTYSQRPSEMSTSIGLLKSRNTIPDWDNIIPICLCSQKNCLCVGNSITMDTVINTIPKDLKTLHNNCKTEESRIKPVLRSRSGENKGVNNNKRKAVNNALPDNCVQVVLLSTNNHLLNPKQNLNSDIVTPSSRPDIKRPLPQRTHSNEANGNVVTTSSNAIGHREREDPTSSTGIGRDTGTSNQNPAAPRKPLPVPVPRKPRKSVLVGQEVPEEGRQGREMTVRKVSLERKSSPSLSVNAPATQAHNIPESPASTNDSWEGLPSSRTPGPPPVPAPPPRKEAFLSEPERAAPTSSATSSQHLLPTSSPLHLLPSSSCLHLPQDVEEEELRWVDDAVYELECSVDKEEEEEGRNEEEEIHGKISCHPLSNSRSNQLELSSNCHFPLTLITTGSYKENASAQNKMAGFPKKLQRRSSPAAWVLKNELSEEREVEERKTSDSDDDGGALTKATKAMRKLPATPGEDKPKRNRIFQTLVSPVSRKRSTDNTQTKGSLTTDETLSPSKPSRSSRGKQKAKSFSSADLTPSEGQKQNSFRRLLNLKLSVKRLPKLAKGGQSLDSTAAEAEQYADYVFQDRGVCFQERLGIRVGDARKFSCPQLGVIGVGAEQSVDGDEIHYPGAEQAVEYENVPYYEAIPEYFNQPVGLGLRGSELGVGTPPDQSECHNHLYDDADIYEEQEPYHPLKRHSEHSSTEEFFYEEQESYHPLKRRSEQQLNQHSSTERSSIDEDVGPLDEGQSDEDVMVQSSDEEDDESSSSSKGEPEKPEEREVGSGAKRNKIVHIAREIMSSENVFVNVLKLLHIDFRDAVAKASRPSGKPIIEEAILNQILYYLPQLYELNQDLLRELEDRVAQWDERGRLADIFVKKGPYLKMYSTYIREFDKNVALLDEHSRKNPAFAAVVREFEAGPRCASLALRHYLLKPVQRIPQYQMLLTDYLKNLSPDSADYKDTQAALGIVKEVANHANDIMKQGDNFQKLIQVQCRLNGHHEIVLPGRVFLKEGVLMKLSRKVMQPRMFFLFNDTLLYTTPVQSGQFKLNNMLSLAGMKVSKPSQEAFQNELTIESVERSFILSGSSAVERDDWLEAISTAINDYTRKKISFISSKTLEETGSENSGSGAPLGSKAPIWIPDPRATMCMVCTCEFTLTWRRHHCRACGKVVCQSCSSNKHCLEYLKNQLARVCDQCFIVLQQRSEKDLSATLSPGGKSSFAFARKTKKIPAALKEVSANTDNSSMSGYLQRSKGNKKQGKRLWFVIKNKVLYTYAASEDVAALESQPLLGFMLKEEEEGAGPPVQKQQFKLYHKNTLHYIFKADDSQTAQRWIDAFKEAMVL
ncbi:FYVE, RhoGEF and PH domain-containing protein 6 [Oncorhynchus mykiss]|uniref:FYVE, RhoGEF and PH domain containing 6 n=1 Tax=Oncorhynchus mykiss TaxID=8022 RepID=A0A8K9XWD0_ONCMY|nr:FYVE, RhoGEF and PH domain-containing protein 6 [Oncorhynchus mykiss]